MCDDTESRGALLDVIWEGSLKQRGEAGDTVNGITAFHALNRWHLKDWLSANPAIIWASLLRRPIHHSCRLSSTPTRCAAYANHAHPSQAPGFPNAILGGSRFEESSAQRDYQAPPLEALRQMLQSRDVQPEAAQPPMRFDGQSSMHADYQAPPLEGLQRWLQGCGLRPEEIPILAKPYNFCVFPQTVWPHWGVLTVIRC